MSRNFCTDQELIDQLVLDDTSAFEELYQRYWFSLYSYAAVKLQSREDAAAVVKKIFVDLWEQRKILRIDFSIQKHFYATIRTEVLLCLNEKMEQAGPQSNLGKKVAREFRFDTLKKARNPVSSAAAFNDISAPEPQERSYAFIPASSSSSFFGLGHLKKALLTMMNL